MELKKGLFSFGDLKNHPSRSGFDLSQKKAFTAKAGELLPVYWDIAFPGDKYDLGHQNFTRTVPVSSAAYVRLREYYDWYFVPFRQINKNLPSALVGMEDNPITASGLTTAKSVVSDYVVMPNKNWFKINPALLNRVFGADVDSTWDTDQFWINAFFDVKVVRNLDYDGMPY